MAEIRRSANRAKGMPIPGVVRRWVVTQVKALAPGPDEWTPPRLSKPVVRLVAELLVEASQRPEFAQWAENCQAAALKTDKQMERWTRMAYTYEKRGALGQSIGNALQVTKYSQRGRRISTINDGNSYRVVFKNYVTAEGFAPPHKHLNKTEREHLLLRRAFPALELAISYRDRVEKAISDPCNRTAKEKAAAAFSVPLYDPSNFKSIQ